MGAHQKMPMVGHQTVRKECNVEALCRFHKYALEGLIVAHVIKKRGAFRGSIDYMKDKSRSEYAWAPRHAK